MDKPKYNTKQRKILLDYLGAHSDETLCANQIAAGLAEKGISLSAIYRNLSDLESEGKIRRVSAENGRQVFYRYIGTEECMRHMHMSCSECGRTFHLDIPLSDLLIKNVAEGSDFIVDSSATVLYGVCGECGRCKETSAVRQAEHAAKRRASKSKT